MSIHLATTYLAHGLVLGPMAGVTDLPFRLLCHEQGCEMSFTEMVSAKAVLYKNKNTETLLETARDEGPVGLQLFGSDPEILSSMGHALEEKYAGRYTCVDINMGCPVPKVVNNGEGSALLKNPELVGRILSSMAEKVRLPITVKIRKGFHKDEFLAADIARIAQAAGVSLITVHGRTREQYYSGKADWKAIAEVKKAVSIPVIASGDIFSGEDALRCLEETHCDGLMIARGAQGNPWIFREILGALEGKGTVARPDRMEIYETILRHARMLVDYKGDYVGLREMRKHVSWYTNGMPHATEIRRQVNQVESMEELEELLQKTLLQKGKNPV